MKKISLLLFLITILYSNCDQCDGPLGRNLRNLEGECSSREVTEGKMCFVNSAGDGCEEKSCEELDSDKCSLFTDIEPTKICKNIEGNCALTNKQCEDMPSENCGSYTPTDISKKCILNADTSTCSEEPKVCEEMPTDNCGI